MRILPRLSAETFKLWEVGLLRFLQVLSDVYPARRIVLVGCRWAREFQAESGARHAFKPSYANLIAPHNALLEQMYVTFKGACPGCLTFHPSKEVEFADPEHRWSKEPFHYIQAYYEEFMNWLTCTVEM